MVSDYFSGIVDDCFFVCGVIMARAYMRGVQLAADLAGVSKHNVMARMAEGKTLKDALSRPFSGRTLDKAKIKHLVEVEKLSLYSVAYVVGCSRTYLATYCKKHKIEKAFPTYEPFFIFHNGEMYSQRQICKAMGWKQNTFSAYWSRRKHNTTAQECFEQYKNKRGLI